MAKSRIIKEFVSGQVSLENTLMRLKVILSDLEDPAINEWINNEIQGYDEHSIPSYREIQGMVKASYVQSQGYNLVQVTNQSLPLNSLPEDIQQSVIIVNIYDGVSSIEYMINEEKEIGKLLSPEQCGLLSQFYGVQLMEVKTICSKNHLKQVLNIVNNKVLDIMIKLEKEFGCLDDLDIISDNNSEGKVNKVKDELVTIIYNDNSIKIGDKNKIAKTGFLSNVRGIINGDKDR